MGYAPTLVQTVLTQSDDRWLHRRRSFVTMDIDQFASEHVTTETDAPFQLENSYTLDVAVDGSVQAKAGSMIAFTGDLSFTGKASGEN